MSELEPYLLLAKQATGKALVSLIQQVLCSASIHSFQPLLDCPNVKLLSTTEDQSWVELLRLFAYGTYRDYITRQSSLPTIGTAETEKLKRLSILTFATKSHLEDLIIDCIQASLISGKLDTRRQIVYIESALARDLAPDTLPGILQSLLTWNSHCEEALTEIGQTIDDLTRKIAQDHNDQMTHDAAVREARSKISQARRQRASGLSADGGIDAGML
ncbi:hypothetical protein MRB53_039315 [Persea americana]|nr:hypothetical protein MRB53_039315 [Persea americana]